MKTGLVRCCCVEVEHSLLAVGCNAADVMEQERLSVRGIGVFGRRRMEYGSPGWARERQQRVERSCLMH